MLAQGSFGAPFLISKQEPSSIASTTSNKANVTTKSSTKLVSSQHSPFTSQSLVVSGTSTSIGTSSTPGYAGSGGGILSSRGHVGEQIPQTNYSALNHYEDIITQDMKEGKRQKRMSSQSSQSDTSHIDPVTNNMGATKVRKKRPKFIRKVICQVCGDVANDHMHYGAIACYSCRAFFRRGVNNNAPYFCSQNQCCSITKQSRKHCQYCRFQKCLGIGMKGTWVMTEEDKLEKKEKAKVRRRWNQMKKYKIVTASNREVNLDYNLNCSSLQTSSGENNNITEISVPKHESNPYYSSSSYNASIKIPNGKIRTEYGHSSNENKQSDHPSILPSAKATARAVVSAAEHEYELAQIKIEDKTMPFNKNRKMGWQQLDLDIESDEVVPSQTKYMLISDPNPNENVHITHTNPIIPYNPHQKIPPLKSVVNISQGYNDDNGMELNTSNTDGELTFGDMPFSADNMQEYHSDSSDSPRDFSPASEDSAPVSVRTLRYSFSSLLLNSKGKLPYGSDLLNEPVMPFTREESNLISNVIAIEKETTLQMPISNETLGAIMHAVKTGQTLSYQATLDGYTVCMKRIIKFASRIDLFREFCSDDQKNLLLSNTDMLVNIRSARMLRPGFNLQDQLSVVYGGKRELPHPTTSMSPKDSAPKKAFQRRLEYQQVYSSPWASGEDQEKKFFAMMNSIFELQMDQTTTALIAMMALFSKVNKYLGLPITVNVKRFSILHFCRDLRIP